MDVYEAVNKRRSIREFKDVPVPYDMLEKCVDAARL
ncbi:MAG: nitroreductase, partial [Gammaproteobacteria bacterium]|nr:nitroreductase [Gammaproteobacteria bacterium]NIW96749.1 nitroreductase [Phycisphaerae bacterium]